MLAALRLPPWAPRLMLMSGSLGRRAQFEKARVVIESSGATRLTASLICRSRL